MVRSRKDPLALTEEGKEGDGDGGTMGTSDTKLPVDSRIAGPMTILRVFEFFLGLCCSWATMAGVKESPEAATGGGWV